MTEPMTDEELYELARKVRSNRMVLADEINPLCDEIVRRFAPKKAAGWALAWPGGLFSSAYCTRSLAQIAATDSPTARVAYLQETDPPEGE